MYASLSTDIHIPNATAGTVAWQSPSNIALVKYWGKFGRQYPRNPSISFTLATAHTDTKVHYESKSVADGISLDFLFEGQANEAFRLKMVKFLASITDIFPFLPHLHLNISSSNSFPHSSGIASSASSMSALALCLCSIEQEILGKSVAANDPVFLQKASYIARLGSGSACRSVYARAAVWGTSAAVVGSSNDYAVPFNDLHSVFDDYQDSILIVSRAEKKVSSRAGHALMNGNPYAAIRYEQAHQNLTTLIEVLKNGDLTQFVEIVEAEALILHALMMCSTPSYLLMRPNTLQVIEKIRQFRADTGHPVCFTLDAGPNVHVLYPKNITAQVTDFINAELLPFCEGGYWIADKMGGGSKKKEK